MQLMQWIRDFSMHIWNQWVFQTSEEGPILQQQGLPYSPLHSMLSVHFPSEIKWHSFSASKRVFFSCQVTFCVHVTKKYVFPSTSMGVQELYGQHVQLQKMGYIEIKNIWGQTEESGDGLFPWISTYFNVNPTRQSSLHILNKARLRKKKKIETKLAFMATV